MEQKSSVHNVITEKVVLTTESPPEIWVWRFRSKQAVVWHNSQVWQVSLKSYSPRVFYSSYTSLVFNKKCETVLANLMSRSDFVLTRVNSN